MTDISAERIEAIRAHHEARRGDPDLRQSWHAVEDLLLALDAAEARERGLVAALEKFAGARRFARMSSIFKPPEDAEWSLGWWHEGRFIAVIALGDEHFDAAEAALKEKP